MGNEDPTPNSSVFSSRLLDNHCVINFRLWAQKLQEKEPEVVAELNSLLHTDEAVPSFTRLDRHLETLQAASKLSPVWEEIQQERETHTPLQACPCPPRRWSNGLRGVSSKWLKNAATQIAQRYPGRQTMRAAVTTLEGALLQISNSWAVDDIYFILTGYAPSRDLGKLQAVHFEQVPDRPQILARLEVEPSPQDQGGGPAVLEVLLEPLLEETVALAHALEEHFYGFDQWQDALDPAYMLSQDRDVFLAARLAALPGGIPPYDYDAPEDFDVTGNSSIDEAVAYQLQQLADLPEPVQETARTLAATWEGYVPDFYATVTAVGD